MATTINFDNSKEKYTQCYEEIREKSFNNALKTLKKKHDNRTLNDLNNVISLIKTFDFTTQNDNHIVKDNYECHIGGHHSDILLIWNYKIEDNKCYVHLIDIINHQQLKNSLSEARVQTALKSNGVYSVMNDEWIKEPVAEDIPEINQEEFNKVFNEWESKYFNIVGEYSSEDELFEKLTKKLLYCYEGPIYKFGRYMKDVYLETKAVSLPQAINNFKYQAAKAIGYNRATGTNVNIRDELVQCLGDTNSSDSEETAPIQRTLCPKCRKAYLNYVGECPICDLNDEDLLYESFDYDLQSKIEEIDDFIEDIYDLRKTSIKDEGEYGIGNLVFKEFRNKGYLDNLKEIKYKLLSKKLSLN